MIKTKSRWAGKVEQLGGGGERIGWGNVKVDLGLQGCELLMKMLNP